MARFYSTRLWLFLGCLFEQDQLPNFNWFRDCQTTRYIWYRIFHQSWRYTNILNTPDTHAIINYVYQRYIKLKNWVSTRHYLYYVWLLYGWREIPHHFPCYNSGFYNDEMILSRWVPKFLSYKEFMNYDHYIIDQQHKKWSKQNHPPKTYIFQKAKILNDPQESFWQPI